MRILVPITLPGHYFKSINHFEKAENPLNVTAASQTHFSVTLLPFPPLIAPVAEDSVTRPVPHLVGQTLSFQESEGCQLVLPHSGPDKPHHIYADRPSSSFPSLFTSLYSESSTYFIGMFKTTENCVLLPLPFRYLKLYPFPP